MLPYRLSVAVLCALLVSGAILGTTPSCGKKVTRSGPACCRNEATCPMHQKHVCALAFNACHGDGADTATVVTHHRAVLAAGVITIDVPQRDHTFETQTTFLPWASIVPRTPPPRVG